MKSSANFGRHPTASKEQRVLAKEAAVQLLERSIRFDHGRLSVLRLAMAVHSGAVITSEHWRYCQQVASTTKDADTQALFIEASQARPIVLF